MNVSEAAAAARKRLYSLKSDPDVKREADRILGKHTRRDKC